MSFPDHSELRHLQIIDRKTLLKLLPISLATLHRLETRGVFSPIKLSTNKVGYRLSAVEAYLERQSLVRARTTLKGAGK